MAFALMTRTKTSTMAAISSTIRVNHRVMRIFSDSMAPPQLSFSTQPVPQTVWISFREKPVSIFLRR